MASHSSTLAWKCPWTEKPGGLPSVGSHRAGHNWSNLAAAASNKDGVFDGQSTQIPAMAPQPSPPIGATPTHLEPHSTTELFGLAICRGVDPNLSGAGLPQQPKPSSEPIRSLSLSLPPDMPVPCGQGSHLPMPTLHVDCQKSYPTRGASPAAPPSPGPC